MIHGNSRPSLVMSIDDFGLYEQKVDVVGDSATLIQDLNISTFPHGIVYLEFVAYDNNNNQAVHIMPIKNDKNSRKYTDNRPGISITTDIYVKANTAGEDLGAYSLSDDSFVSIVLYVDTYNNEGIMVYRGTEANNLRYVGSSSYRGTFVANNDLHFLYSDKSPSLEDGKTYYYQVKYYKNVSSNVEYSEFSDVITVPIMPRVQSTLTSPTQDQVYETVPDNITFNWDVAYTDIPTEIASNTTRKDTMLLQEVATVTEIISSLIEVGSADINTSQSMSYVADINNPEFSDAGRTYFWTVNSELLYEVTDGFVVVESRSRPTVSAGDGYDGSAQNGTFRFAIKAVDQGE